MSHADLLASTKEGVTRLCLNRPAKCNALDGPLIGQLLAAFSAAAQDPQTQLILLSGEGAHFCAGADIDWMRKLAEGSVQDVRNDAHELATLLYSMYSFPKPIVTLVQGRVIGGGLGLLACSDIVLAAEDAGFCFSEVKLGLVPAVVSPYVVAVMGQAAARYYFLTAEQFGSTEALHLGLVHKRVPGEALASAGTQMVQALLQHSPAALGEVKRLLPWVSSQAISPALAENTAELFANLRLSKQGQEGLKAFLEKRLPRWEGSL